MSLYKKVIFYSILLILIAAPLEGFAYVVGKYLHKNGVLYVIPPTPADSNQTYLVKRDQILGWPSPYSFGEGDLDLTGARVSPAFSDQTEACISLYGDSFTWSAEVDNEHAWGNLLAELANCRVSNYGVGGYGTDQAYLRFRYNEADQAQVVILNHWPENIRRNVNQFRYLLDSGTHFSLKPRFILNENDTLEMIPIPNLSEDDYFAMVRIPELYLKHEYFIPNRTPGFASFSFPYTWSVGQSINHHLVRAKLQGRPFHTEFYRADHPSGGLMVTAEIMKQFHVDAVASGRIPILGIIPSNQDLIYYQQQGYWVYQPLIDRLNADGIEVLNLGSGIIDYLGDDDVCTLFRATNCNAHFNEVGYQVLANLVYTYLSDQNLLP